MPSLRYASEEPSTAAPHVYAVAEAAVRAALAPYGEEGASLNNSRAASPASRASSPGKGGVGKGGGKGGGKVAADGGGGAYDAAAEGCAAPAGLREAT